MDKLKGIEEALQLLKDSEAVFFLTQNSPTFFTMRKDKILVKGAGSTYRIDEQQFIELFHQEDFYLYEPVLQEVVDLARDDEYYSWRHK